MKTLIAPIALSAALLPAIASAAPPKKSIVLVHGAWADGSSWDKVVPLLAAKGYNVVAVHQPLTSLADDVAAVKRVVDAQPGEVLLVGHSYGGVIITEAGNDPKVTGLVYVAAFGPDAGESINELSKAGPPPDWAKGLKVEDGYAVLPPDDFAANFAQDLPAADQKLDAAKQGWTSMKCFDGKPSVAAWKTKATWYVRAEQDRMIPPAAEQAWAKRMNAKLTSLPTSHVAMLAKPREVANVILEAAASPVKK